MKSRSVSIAWKIMVVPNFVALFFGLVFTFIPDVMLTMGYESFTGQSWSAFVSASPKTVDWILLTAGRMYGVHILAMAVLFLAVTFMSFRKGERWSWYALLIGATLVWIFDAVATLIMGIVPIAIGNVVMLLIVYTALGISAKDILSKKIAPKPDV